MPLIEMRIESSWLVITHIGIEVPKITCFVNEENEFCISGVDGEIIKSTGGDTETIIEYLLDREAYILKSAVGNNEYHQLKIVKLNKDIISELRKILETVPTGDKDDGERVLL